MSDLTSELNLALAVEDDDTDDYLTTNAGLRGSLATLDGLFNATTGHNHQGSHQGGNFTSLSLSGTLTVGGNLTVTGTSSLGGDVSCSSTLSVIGAATLGSLTVSGAASLGSLTVSGAAALSGGLTVVNVTASGYVAAGPLISGVLTGDLSANRNNNTGYVFLANGSHYLGFDGTYYQLPSSELLVNGSWAVTETNTRTLSNKTLVGPTLTGTVAGAPTWTSAQAFAANTTVGGDSIVRGAGAARSKLVTGVTTSGSVANNSATPIAVSFGYTFSTAPDVVVSLMDSSNRATHDLWGICRYNVTTTGMTIEFLNRTGSQQTCFASWIAFGGA